MEWISVKDRLPEEDDDYLTYVMDNGCSYRREVQRFSKEKKCISKINPEYFTHWEMQRWDDNIVTHWMPLPELPPDSSYLDKEP
jgi:hypothetical protein